MVVIRALKINQMILTGVIKKKKKTFNQIIKMRDVKNIKDTQKRQQYLYILK